MSLESDGGMIYLQGKTEELAHNKCWWQAVVNAVRNLGVVAPWSGLFG
jgi:hypothetical protein